MQRGIALFLSLLFTTLGALAAGREISPAPIEPTSAVALDRRLVAASGGRFLTVWQEAGLGPVTIRGALSDSEGRTISPRSFTILSGGPFIVRSLTGTGDAFVLVVNIGDQTVFHELDLNGRVTRTRVLPSNIGIEAWNGSRLLGVAYVDGIFSAVLLDRFGTPLVSAPLNGAVNSLHSIAPAGDGFVIVASEYDVQTRETSLVAFRIGNEGSSMRQLLAEGEGNASGVVAQATGSDVLLAWTDRFLLHTAIFTRNGELGPTRRVPFDGVYLTHMMRTPDGYVIAHHNAETIGILVLAPDGTMRTNTTRFLEISHTAPVAASNGSTMLVVYAPRGTLQVAGLPVGADGNSRAPQPLAISPAAQLWPVLATGQGSVLAAWSERSGTAFRIGLRLLDAQGVPLSETRTIPGQLASTQVAFNGSEYLLLGVHDMTVFGIRVAADGTIAATFDIRPGMMFDPRAGVTWAGDRWIVVLPGAQFLTITPNGIVSPVRMLTLNAPRTRDASGALEQAALSYDGTTLLLAWNEFHAAACYWFPPIEPCLPAVDRTFVTRLSREGDVLGARPLEVDAAIHAPSLATSGSEFVVAGVNSATALEVRDGALGILAWRPLPRASSRDVHWDGAAYAVADRLFTTRWYVGLSHLGRDLRDVAPRRGLTTAAPGFGGSVSIAGAVIAVQELDVEMDPRLIAYQTSEMQPLPAPPQAPANVRVTQTGSVFEVTWDAAEGTVDVYEVRSLDGELLASVTPDQPLRATTRTRQVQVIAINAGGASQAAAPATGRRRTSAA
ncbi:MAG TPA: hypothetical protein VNI54_03350 [Thermoanaerobaculia bacterium]|nr:hypothetical protein [Thermoanaerobaculia bacterium]